jgi:predicted NUDIX family NTP pyrophosphohydrolase
MTPKLSAALLLYRSRRGLLEVMLVHMGGPFWARKDAGAWSLPKGEHAQAEDSLSAARREFAEETGRRPPTGDPIDLGVIRQPSGKLIQTWAIEADMDVSEITSNSVELEWPRGSGRIQVFPEVDRADWFDIGEARRKLVKGQVAFVDALLACVQERVSARGPQAVPSRRPA